MATEIFLPAMSPTMEEGTLAKWLVNEGDKIKAGQTIAEIETDKATMELEADDDGILARILVAAGTDGVKVGTPIALIAEEGENLDALAAGEKPVTPQAPAADAAKPQAAESAPPAVQPSRAEAQPRKADVRDPEITGEVVKKTVREALRDAMAEEMRRDQSVFVMGEEVAQYQGAYKVTQGLLDEFGPDRVIDTPITEHGFAGVGTGAAMASRRASRTVLRTTSPFTSGSRTSALRGWASGRAGATAGGADSAACGLAASAAGA